jgi:PAS domain-containing protein
MISFDLETHLICRPIAAPRPVCMAWTADGEIANISQFGCNGDALDRVWEFLQSKQLLVNQVMAFDMTCLMAYEPDLVGPIFDAYDDERVESIDLNQKLIDIANGELKFRKLHGGYALDKIAHRYGMEIDKSNPWRMRYAELDDLPLEFWPEDAREYPREDALAPFKIRQAQKEICAEWQKEYRGTLLEAAPRRAQYDFALRLCQNWGVRTDATRVKELKLATERRMYELWKGGWISKDGRRHAPLTEARATYLEKGKRVQAPLVRASGTKNMKAVQALVQSTFEARGEPVPMTEPKPNPKTRITPPPRISTSRDTCILSGNPVLENFAEYARTGSLIKRIEDLEHGIDLPLQPRYDSLLESGRTSSSKGSSKKPQPGDLLGIQIQNFPRAPDAELKRVMMQMFGRVSDARATLAPRPGNVFILADYSAGELHTLAQACRHLFGFSDLGDMLNAGIDVHLWFGAIAYGNGITYEEALERYKAGDPEVKAWRQSAKPITFGRPGGMGAKRMVITARKSYGVRFTLAEAKRLIALFDREFEEIRLLFAYGLGAMSGRATCKVYHLGTGMWRGGCTYSAACNQQFQHLLAAGALPALFQVTRECYSCEDSSLYGFRPVTFVHDEIVCEGPIEDAAPAVARLSEIMERELNRLTPDYPTKAEPVITKIWTKDAKAVYDAAGEQIAWEPQSA